MGKKVCEFMHGWFSILWCMAVLLSAMFPAKALLAGQEQVDCPPLAGVKGVETWRQRCTIILAADGVNISCIIMVCGDFLYGRIYRMSNCVHGFLSKRR